MAGIFTAAQIAGFRGLVQELAMPDSYEVLRTGPPTPNGYGGQQPGTETVASTGACLVKEQPSGSEQAIAASLQVERPVVVELPTTVDLTEADVLRINGSRRLAVIAVDRGGNWAVTLTAVCSEVS